jgi:Uma2 family endonuclease
MAAQDDMQATGTSPTKYTYDDYLSFPDDGRRHELIDGDHYVTPSPNLRHQEISRRLSEAIGLWLRDHAVGRIFYAPLDVILSNSDVVEPDLLYVSNEHADILQDWVRGAPDLVIEILSPGTRKVDETIKRRLYDRVGVHEYWIVDPELELVKVHRRTPDGFPRVAELTREEAQILGSPLLAGLEIPLADLFRS